MTPPVRAAIPLPIQIVVDDVGWWRGEDGSLRGEPYRTGMSRDHVPADYTALVELGRRLNMRPQAAFILCEWDKTNLLRELPSSTWQGASWDNSRLIGEAHEEAADIIRGGREHLELTLHGIGHEFWSAGPDASWQPSRAEWFDRFGNLRPEWEIRRHLEYFQLLLDQHQLGSFPTSFVPCALNYHAGPDGGLTPLLAEAGIDFISTQFSKMFGRENFPAGRLFDGTAMLVDRGNDLQAWNTYGTKPEGELTGPIRGLHWPNLLHQDPVRNLEIVEAWVNLIQPYENRLEWTLARDTATFQSQLCHHHGTAIELEADRLELSFRDPASSPRQFRPEFVIKLETPRPLDFVPHGLELIHVEVHPTNESLRYHVLVRRDRPTRKARIAWRPAFGY